MTFTIFATAAVFGLLFVGWGMLAGDGSYRVLNRNDGITEADYYDRGQYRESFLEVFDQLKRDGVFTRTIPEIENSDLFKLSPFKALTQDQALTASFRTLS